MALPRPIILPSSKFLTPGDWDSLLNWVTKFSKVASDAYDRIADEFGGVGTSSYYQIETKSIFIPEYPGATFNATPGGANLGYMLTDNALIAGQRFNYYLWYTTEATLQNYDVIFQTKIPYWYIGIEKLTIDLWTETVLATNSHVDIELQKDGVIDTYSTLENLVSDDDTWKCERNNNAIGVFDGNTDAVLKSLKADDLLNIRMTLNSKYGYAVTIGNITFEYKNPMIGS